MTSPVLTDSQLERLGHLLDPNQVFDLGSNNFSLDLQSNGSKTYFLAQINLMGTLIGDLDNKKLPSSPDGTNYYIVNLEDSSECWMTRSNLKNEFKDSMASFQINNDYVVLSHSDIDSNANLTRLIVWTNQSKISIPIYGMRSLYLVLDGHSLYFGGTGDSSVTIGTKTYSSSQTRDLVIGKYDLKHQQILWARRSNRNNAHVVVNSIKPGFGSNVVLTGSFNQTINLDKVYDNFNSTSGWAGTINCNGDWVSAVVVPSSDDNTNNSGLEANHVNITDSLCTDHLELVGSYKGKLGCNNSNNIEPFYWSSKEPNKFVAIKANITQQGANPHTSLVSVNSKTHIGFYFDTLLSLNGVLYRNKGETGVMVIDTNINPVHHLGYNYYPSPNLTLRSNNDGLWLVDDIILYRTDTGLRTNGVIAKFK